MGEGGGGGGGASGGGGRRSTLRGAITAAVVISSDRDMWEQLLSDALRRAFLILQRTLTDEREELTLLAARALHEVLSHQVGTHSYWPPPSFPFAHFPTLLLRTLIPTAHLHLLSYLRPLSNILILSPGGSQAGRSSRTQGRPRPASTPISADLARARRVQARAPPRRHLCFVERSDAGAGRADARRGRRQRSAA